MTGTGPVGVGVDGCRAGWVAVILDGAAAPRAKVFARFDALVAALPLRAVIAVDMPIGLPARTGSGGRGPEKAVRKLLGARQSSVFAIPPRAAVEAGDYAEACRLALAHSDPPRKVSKQAFHLFAKIREIDALLRTAPGLRPRIIECHPELAFWRLNGGRAMALPKKIKSRVNPAGMDERLGVLVSHGFPRDFLTAARPPGAACDDLLDSAAVALIARRHIDGTTRPFPDPPGRDEHGLAVAIWA